MSRPLNMSSQYMTVSTELRDEVLKKSTLVKAAKDIDETYYLPIFYCSVGVSMDWEEWAKVKIEAQSGMKCSPTVHIEEIANKMFYGWIRVCTKEAFNSLRTVMMMSMVDPGFFVEMDESHGDGGQIWVKDPLQEDVEVLEEHQDGDAAEPAGQAAK